MKIKLLVPLVVAGVFMGTTAAFAAGAFETNDSGFDTPHDLSERGAVTDEPTTTT